MSAAKGPLVSVVMPILDTAAYLPEANDSLHAQPAERRACPQRRHRHRARRLCRGDGQRRYRAAPAHRRTTRPYATPFARCVRRPGAGVRPERPALLVCRAPAGDRARAGVPRRAAPPDGARHDASDARPPLRSPRRARRLRMADARRAACADGQCARAPAAPPHPRHPVEPGAPRGIRQRPAPPPLRPCLSPVPAHAAAGLSRAEPDRRASPVARCGRPALRRGVADPPRRSAGSQPPRAHGAALGGRLRCRHGAERPRQAGRVCRQDRSGALAGMTLYYAYGVRIASACPLHFPRAADGACDLSIVFAGVSTELVPPSSRSLTRDGDDWCLTYADAARLWVAYRWDAAGARLIVSRHQDWAASGYPLTGVVMAVLLAFLGMPVLHGAALALDDRAIVLLGVSGLGKSTLAAALVGRGARLLTDDVVRLLPRGAGFCVMAGVLCLSHVGVV